MIAPDELREHFRRLHAVAPESAAAVEQHLFEVTEELAQHVNDDVFRAFVIRLARESGVTQGILARLEAGPLASLAQAEADRAAAAKMEAERAKDRSLTVRKVLSEPAVLAVIGLVSTILTGIGAAAVMVWRTFMPAGAP